jgi:kynurenine formamidase
MPAGSNLSPADFEAMFEEVKNWGRWGPDDRLGTLNFITPEKVRAAAGLVREGRAVSMALPFDTATGPDNPRPAIHSMRQLHDRDIGSGAVRFATDYVGIEYHGDAHTHVDALCHLAYDGRLYGGRSSDMVTPAGATALGIEGYANGIVGRGVLLDVPRFRGIDWLEPGEAVERSELEAIEHAQGVELGEGDVFVFRTGHHGRRLALGPWDPSPAGSGKAGLHVDTIPWMFERRIAAFLPDGDGEAAPSTVDGILYPIHPLQITAMGMACADNLQLEDLARTCAELGRWDFLVVGVPLRIPGGTGSPWNPIAIF